MPDYKKPPIIEAVIELRFAATIDPVLLGKIDKQFSKAYPFGQPMKGYGVQLDVQPSGLPRTEILDSGISYRRSTGSSEEMAVLSPQALIISQLPPYTGWDDYFKRFKRDWVVWKKIAKNREISRIGVRYINRIDIPSKDPVIQQDQYLHVYGETPDSLGPTLSYAAQMTFLSQEGRGTVVINTLPVIPPPLIETYSFILDIDVSRQVDIPRKDDDIYAVLQDMRAEKNRVFEACVTDKARELFK